MWCWGAHDAGALGIGETEAGPCSASGTGYPCAPTPVRVPLDQSVSDLAAGYYHVCALTSGDVLCWGDQDALQTARKPRRLETLDEIDRKVSRIGFFLSQTLEA